MGTGGKIAIGCGVALVLAVIVTVLALGGLAFWVKGATEHFAKEQNRIEELRRRANANRYRPSADGTIAEDRLQTFLDVRKQVHAVYEKHKTDLDEMSKKKDADFGDVRRGFALINELRAAQAQALADLRMSEEEYRTIADQVYRTTWATEGARAPSVPAANVALFRRHEADIKKYAMDGLDWTGL